MGMSWPNDMVAALSRPPQASQSGALKSPTKLWVRAVKLDYLFVRHSRQAVKPVDILRDKAEQLASCLKITDGVVADVWFHVFIKLVGFLLHLPVTDARGFAGKKFIEVDRLVPGPDAAGAAEVGDSGFRADPRSGKKNYLTRDP
jgi:hypothetical protein